MAGMVGMSLPGWMLAGLATFAILSTLVAGRLVLGWRLPLRTGHSWPWLATYIAASALWVAMVFAAGMLAVRYAERMEQPWIGLLAYGTGMLGLSVLQVNLFRRVGEHEVSRFWPGLVHTLVYPLAAIVLFLLFSGFLQRRAEPWLLLPLLLGTVLPGLLARLLRIKAHSLASLLLMSLATSPFISLLGMDGWEMIVVGYLAHLLVDLLRPPGIAAGWPVRKPAVRLWGGLVRGSSAERWAVVLLVGLVALLLTQVEVGPAQAPVTPVLSFEQTVTRYYSLRGRTLVFAQIWGSWQVSGRPASGQFEVLNAEGSSLVLLDRFDGTVFSAGRQATDDFYVNQISLSTGSAVQIKPVEVRLERQYLAEALPTVYAMQREPGLEHIFVSGNLLVADAGESALRPSLSLRGLPAIEWVSLGHYRLNYLTAAELRELAETPITAADLIVVATYRTPVEGPTATPLPPMPAIPEAKP